MKELEARVRSYLNLATVYALLMVFVGLLFIIFPDLVNDVIRWGLAVTLIGGGIFVMIKDFTSPVKLNLASGAVAGALMLVMGMIIAFHPAVLEIVPILVGIWMIVSSVSSLRLSAAFKNTESTGVFALSVCMSLISILAGVFLIIRPGIGGLAVTSFIGIVIMIYAISSLLDIAVYRKNLNTIADYFKQITKKATKSTK